MPPKYYAQWLVGRRRSRHHLPLHANQSSSAVFQAGGLVVVLVEVSRRAYLASIVPVIVNAILNEHQIIVDIVAFVGRGDFPGRASARSSAARSWRGG